MIVAAGSALGCWRYPVKSLQGLHVEHLDLGVLGVDGDRSWAFVDAAGKIASAKRYSTLLMAAADDRNLTLPDGRQIALEDPAVDETVSAWLGRPMTLQRAQPGHGLTYEMTFDPPDDGAELFDIPALEGTFLDLSPLHLNTASPNHFGIYLEVRRPGRIHRGDEVEVHRP